MKKIFLLLPLLLLASFLLAQHPIGNDSFALQTLGSSNTLVESKGSLTSIYGVIHTGYADTTNANLTKIKNYPGAMIRITDDLYMRNSTATKWNLINAAAASNTDSLFGVQDNIAAATRNFNLNSNSFNYSTGNINLTNGSINVFNSNSGAQTNVTASANTGFATSATVDNVNGLKLRYGNADNYGGIRRNAGNNAGITTIFSDSSNNNSAIELATSNGRDMYLADNGDVYFNRLNRNSTAWGLYYDSATKITTYAPTNAYLYFDPIYGGGYYNGQNDVVLPAPDTSKVIGALATQWDLQNLALGGDNQPDSIDAIPRFTVDSLSHAPEGSPENGHSVLPWATTTGDFATQTNNPATWNGSSYDYAIPHNGDILRTIYNAVSKLNGKDETYQYDSAHDKWNRVSYPAMNGLNYQLAQLRIGTKRAYPVVTAVKDINVDSFDIKGNHYNLKLKDSATAKPNNYTWIEPVTGKERLSSFDPLNGVIVNATDSSTFDDSGWVHITVSSGSGSVESVTGNVVDNTDPANPVVTAIADSSALHAQLVQLRSAQLLKLNISDTASMLSSYSTKINKNIDSITAHNTRIINEAIVRDNADIKTVAVTGTTTKTVTLTKGDATTITTTFTDQTGGGGGLDTSNMINMNMFSGLGLSDNRKIQLAYNIAQPLGKWVFIGWNNDRNSRLVKFDSAVRIGSNSYIFVAAGDTLQKSDSCRDNLFRTTNIDYGVTNWLSNPLYNINIYGNGAVIMGANNPRSSGDAYQTISLTPTVGNGFSYGTDVGKTGRSQHGDWRNNGIQLSNVNTLHISGFRVLNMEAYGITMGHCRNVWVDGIVAQMQGYANADTNRILHNQGTLDFHQGANNISVFNCTGFSQDDFLAFNLTNNTDSVAGHYGYYPEGDTASASVDSNTNIVAYNIHVGSNANTIRSFIPPGSFHGNNYAFNNISNEVKSTDPFYWIQGGGQASAIQIGATATGFYGGNTSWGQWDNIRADNIRSYSTTYLIRVQNRIQNANFVNLYKTSVPTTADVYKDGSFADFKNVTSSRVDSSIVTLLSFSGSQVIQTDSLTNLYHTSSLGVVPFLKVTGLTALGEQALNSFGTGGNASNVAIGNLTQFKNTGGNFNTAVGTLSMWKNTTGSSNTAMGYNTLDSCDGCNANVALGNDALKANTGSNNTAVGTGALKANTSATANVAVGYQALLLNSTGHDNTVIGYNAYPVSPTYSYNTMIGSSAGSGSSGGSENTAVGYQALQNMFANDNTAVGAYAFKNLGTSGSNNIALGISAGEDQTGSSSYNIIISPYGQLPTLSGSNQLNIGNLIYSTTVFHTGSKSSTAVTDPVVGIGIAAPTSTLHDFGSFATAYAAKSGSYTLTRTDHTIEVTATGQTMTLPTAVGITGRIYSIKLTASGSATIATTSSQTIDGSTTYSLSAQYKYVTVQSNGANWLIIANN